MADKSYESYEMLAKLLNSGRKENIDNVYDALSEVISGEYQLKKQQNKNTFAQKKDALAKNRAKAEKYLDYFMTDKGYNGSGIEADAKLKASIGYNSDLASLNASEALADSELDAGYISAKLKNEAERNEKKAESDKDYTDDLYKAYNDEADRALKRDQLEYQRYSDDADRTLKRDQFDYQKEADEKDRIYKQSQLDYQRYSDDADRTLQRNKLDYQREADDKDREYKYSQLDYQRYSDDADRTLKRDQFDYQKEADEKDSSFKQNQLDYQRYSDDADRELKRDQLAYQRESDDKDREYKYAELNYKQKDSEADRELKKTQQEKEAELEKLKLDQQKYQNEKEYEIKLLQAQTNAAKTSGTTAAEKEETALLKEKLDSYRQYLYQELKTKFDLTDDINEKQIIYDSVTGVNTERATEIYGAALYKSMIKDFSKGLNEAKAKKADAETVQKLYDRFVAAKDEYHYQTYLKLKRELEYSNYPGFTADQLERAYKAYKSNGQVG